MKNLRFKIIVILLVQFFAVPIAFGELVVNSGMDSTGQQDMVYGGTGSLLDWHYSNSWGGWFDGAGVVRFSGAGNGPSAIPSWSSAALWQDTGFVYQANTVYTMTIRWMDVGDTDSIAIQLIDADTWTDVTDVISLTVDNGGPGVWIETVSTLDTAVMPGVVGNKIGVGFRLTDAEGSWVDVDSISVVTDASTDVAINVDPAQAVLDINPNFFGTCLMYWSETDADMADGVVAQHLADMPIKFLRFPGGTDSDGYIWNTHLLYDNTRWPFEEGPGTMDTDEFMTLCNNINAEPIICVNTELAFFETAQQAIDLAADWVTYCNVTNNYNVKYWEIGNEPFWKTRFTATEYASLLSDMAVAMKAVDPTISIVAAGTVNSWEVGVKDQIPPSQWAIAQNYEYLYEQTLDRSYIDQVNALKTISGTSWWQQVFDNAGSSIDAISIHWYFNPNSLPTMTQTISDLRAYCKQRLPGKDLPIMVTEWNEYAGAGPLGLVRALDLAESAGRLLDGGVSNVALWPLRTPGWLGEQRLLEMENNESPTVNYEVLQLFARTIGTQKVSSSSSYSGIYHFASMTETGNVSIVLINRSGTDRDVYVAVNGYSQGQVTVRRIKSTGDPSSNNTILEKGPKDITTGNFEVLMPGYSILQVTFSCANSGTCNFADLVAMASVWLSEDTQWDIAPPLSPDGTVDWFDFGLLNEFWNPSIP